MLFFTTKLNLYIIETDANNSNHHGMNTNTSPHVVTTDPRAKDKILGIIRGEFTEYWDLNEHGQFYITDKDASFSSRDDSQFIILKSHLGRSVYLGEDGASSDGDRDITEQLFLEKLNGYDWQYAPVTAEFYHEQEISDELFYRLNENCDRYFRRAKIAPYHFEKVDLKSNQQKVSKDEQNDESFELTIY